MSATEKPFSQVHTMHEALANAMQAAENRTFVNNTPANHAAATFMGAAQWMLVQLATACTHDELVERMVELQLEFQAIFDHLVKSPRASH